MGSASRPSIALAIKLFFYFCSVALLAVTSNSIREDWGDIAYLLNALFVLLGGKWLGDTLATRHASRGSREKEDR
jgi:hypothetical protein